MRFADFRGRLLTGTGAGAPAEFALCGALAAGVASLVASTGGADAPVRARGIAQVETRQDAMPEPSDTMLARELFPANPEEPESLALAPAAAVRIVLPEPTAVSAADEKLLLPVSRPSRVRIEPAVIAQAEPMVVAVRIDLPQARPIALPEQATPAKAPALPVKAREQVALVENRGFAPVDLPHGTALVMRDDDTIAPPALTGEAAAELAPRPRPVLVASLERLEQRFSQAASFDLRKVGDVGTPDTLAPGAIEVTKSVKANGRDLGTIPLRIAADSTVSIKLGDLVEMFRTQMNSRNFAELDASVRANTYVSFRRLRDAGIDVRYDPVSDSVAMVVDG